MINTGKPKLEVLLRRLLTWRQTVILTSGVLKSKVRKFAKEIIDLMVDNVLTEMVMTWWMGQSRIFFLMKWKTCTRQQ